ncbi:MAG: ATP-binding protein [Pseudomonadota bacterium]
MTSTSTQIADDIQTSTCPVSGLPIRTSAAWTYTHDAPYYQAQISVIGDHVIYTRVKGYVTIDALKVVIPLVRKVICENIGDGVPYAQIEDYRDLQRATFEARRFFIKDIIARPNLAALICCHVSPLFKVNIRMAMRVTRYHFTVAVADDTADALKRAWTALNIDWPAAPAAEDLRCPSTGLPITQRPQWTAVALGNGLHATVTCTGARLITSRVTGAHPMEEAAVSRWIATRNAVLAQMLPHGGAYIELLNVAHTGVRAALHQIAALAAAPAPAGCHCCGLVVFNASAGINAGLWLKRLLAPAPIPVTVRGSHHQAITLAASQIKETAAWDTPPESTCLDATNWSHSAPNYQVRFDIVDDTILLGVCSGHYTLKDVAPSMAALSRAADSMPPGIQPCIVAIDVSRLTGTARKARKAHMEAISRWFAERPAFRLHVFFGADRMTRATINLLRPLVSMDVRIVEDMAAARQLAVQVKTPSLAARPPAAPPTVADAGIQPYIDELLGFLASINWESDGMDRTGEAPDVHHPLQPVYDAIALIKGDLDDLFRERNAAETERLILASAIEQSTDAVVITDRTGRIIYTNPAFYRITAKQAIETIGQPLAIIQNGSAAITPAAEDLMATIEKGSIWRNLIIVEGDDESPPYRVDATVSPIMDNRGNIINHVATLRDVSHENALETQLRQRRKMEAIGTLAGGIAHDFNNILFPIIGFAEMAQEQLPANSPAKESLKEIFTAALRARDLVQQILMFSRQKETRREPVLITPIILEAMRFLRATLPATIEIEDHLTDADLTVLADATQLYQVIINLGSNALQAMEGSGGVLTISTEVVTSLPADADLAPSPDVGSYVRLQVTDTGTGISPHNIDRVFDPFFTTKGPGSGTGMGLSIVHGIVAAHAGRITLDSQPGMGTQVNVYLPLLSEKPTVVVPMPVLRIKGNNDRLLVVDDEPSIVRMLTGMLEHEGFRVSAFTRPKTALEAFEASAQDFCLVITDLTMPEMTGDALADAIERIRPDIPVIICTGFRNMIQKTRLSAHRKFLPKPVVKQDLLATIDCLRGQPLHHGPQHDAHTDN